MIHPQPPAPRPARLTWAAVGLAALVLVIRRPWALLTPQLWAEDGSVHLLQNDQFGAGALFLPYRGYLHLLPRLIAWLASHAADVTHWPLLYNGAAFLIMMALLARFASSRLDLPGKPWLVLAFVLAAHTNEVFFNITNLHWVTAFFLLQQVLIARPATAAQRIGDLLLTAVIGLTGPFVVVFLPLFGWRWLRDRHPDNMAKTLLVTGSSGLIGSEVCVYFAAQLGYTVHGVDNNQRAVFFGPQGDTRWNQQRLAKELPGFVHHELDIRDRAGVLALVKRSSPPSSSTPPPSPRTTAPPPSRSTISTPTPSAR
jgi:hypothetical protein